MNIALAVLASLQLFILLIIMFGFFIESYLIFLIGVSVSLIINVVNIYLTSQDL
jgi:hypothetical protein